MRYRRGKGRQSGWLSDEQVRVTRTAAREATGRCEWHLEGCGQGWGPALARDAEAQVLDTGHGLLQLLFTGMLVRGTR